MNVSCDFQNALPPITKKRIKTRTWYVEFMLEVTSEVSDVTDDPDFDLAQRIKKILDAADQERKIRTLANVSFSYDAEHRWYGNIVNISGFLHASDQIRDCTVKSYIQDPHVLDQHWKPVSVEPGKHCNWWEHETIRGLVSACASGHRVRVDCKWTGDTSAPVNKGGRPKNCLMRKTLPRALVRRERGWRLMTRLTDVEADPEIRQTCRVKPTHSCRPLRELYSGDCQ